MLKDFLKKIDNKIAFHLRKRYQILKVCRPYTIETGTQKKLEGKVAVVTGGSGAIGRAISFRLAAEGAVVYVCGTRQERIDAVVQEIITAGLKAKPQILNVLDTASIEMVFENIASSNNGHIDILINSAGGSARENANNIVDQNVEIIDSLLDVNLRGAMVCSKFAAKYMIKQKRGKIINITSVIGIQGKSGFSEYAASKGGSIAFARSLAQELGKYNINVNCVSPGIVQRGEIKQEMINELSRTNFLNTYGKPEDISNAVYFLCSDEASFITGHNLVVDGGRSLGLKEY
ncbi:MAG: SDR family oxidoreductase [Bacteroidaceae bacterium]|nr:SDR family oxidoreductase [Bacteroidaceae bacterium]